MQFLFSHILQNIKNRLVKNLNVMSKEHFSKIFLQRLLLIVVLTFQRNIIATNVNANVSGIIADSFEVYKSILFV